MPFSPSATPLAESSCHSRTAMHAVIDQKAAANGVRPDIRTTISSTSGTSVSQP